MWVATPGGDTPDIGFALTSPDADDFAYESITWTDSHRWPLDAGVDAAMHAAEQAWLGGSPLPKPYGSCADCHPLSECRQRRYCVVVNTTWQAAESMAVRHMRALGYHDAQQTNAGADAGLDAISPAHRVAAQVKDYAGPVGRPDLQKLAGAAAQYSERLFYARSGYTAVAAEYAQAHDMALFTWDINSFVIPFNTRASQLNMSLDADFKLERIRARELETARAAFKQAYPPPSAWGYEHHREYTATLLRSWALDDVWSALVTYLQASDPGGAPVKLAWLEQARTRTRALRDEQTAAQSAVTRHWGAEIERMQSIRALTHQLEQQWTAYLAATTDVTGLLNAAVALELDDTPDFRTMLDEHYRPEPLHPLPTQADWVNLWNKRAVTMVRFEGLLTALTDIDSRARSNRDWSALALLSRGMLSDVPREFDQRPGWVGPEHFNVRYDDIGMAHSGVMLVEKTVTEFWGRTLDARRLVDKHAAAWMRRNGNRTDIRPLIDSRFVSVPLWP